MKLWKRLILISGVFFGILAAFWTVIEVMNFFEHPLAQTIKTWNHGAGLWFLLALSALLALLSPQILSENIVSTKTLKPLASAIKWLIRQWRHILFAVLLIILELVLYGLGGREFVAFSFAHLVLVIPLVLLLFAPKRATVAFSSFEDDSRSSLDTRTTAVLRFGEQIAIRTFDNKYVTADENSDSSVVARIEQITEWGIFEIVHASEPSATKRPVHYGDEVAFKVASSGNFVSARLDLQNELKANVSWLRGWETFILLHPTDTTAAQGKVVHYGDSFALQAKNGKYVMYNVSGNGELSAVISHTRSWETFVVVNPSDSK